MLTGVYTPPSTLTTPASSAALVRLARFLRAHSGQFALGLIRATAESVQKELIHWIRSYCAERGLRAVILERGQSTPEEFVRQVEEAAGSDSVFVFTGTEREFLGSGDLGAILNTQREQLARWCLGPVLFLFGDRAMDRLLIEAPDLMDWHAATFSFELPLAASPINRDRVTHELSDRSIESIEGTIEVLRGQLTSSGLSPSAEAGTCLELARLCDSIRYSLPRNPAYQRQISLDTAADLSRDSATEAIRRFRELGGGNDFRYAKPLADALDILAGYEARKGDRSLALELAREAVMFRRAGDAQSEEALAALALSLDKLATALEALGRLDEALRIRLEEELPVYEKLGDVRSRAVTQGQIADIRMARGDLDEALRICQNELLPAFEKLGDLRERAVTLGQIADIRMARGDLDEALRIRLEEQLPVFEKLGDVRERAVTLGRIADIRKARGDLDEALRIRLEEQLPVYEKLGDVQSRAVTQGQIADIRMARGDLDEALRIYENELLPAFENLGDVRSRAVTQGKIAQIHAARGDYRTAIDILESEVVPVDIKLGDEIGLVYDRAQLAIWLFASDPARATTFFHQALDAARRMRLSVAHQIESAMEQRGIPTK